MVVLIVVVGFKKLCLGDFFLLIVNYEEKMYFVGKVFGGFLKCEGCFSDCVILIVCLIDCLICLLFVEGFCNEV